MRKQMTNLSEDLNMLGLGDAVSKLTEDAAKTVPDYIKSWSEAGYKIALVETKGGAVVEPVFQLGKYPQLLQERVAAGGGIIGTPYSFKLHSGKLGGKQLTEEKKIGGVLLSCLICGAKTRAINESIVVECSRCHQPINGQLAESVEYLSEGNPIPGRKSFYTQYGLGSSKYSISDYDGVKTHPDGSPFYGLELFNNKEKFEQKVKELKAQGYIEESKSKLSELNSQGEPVHEKKEVKCRYCGKPSEDGSGVCEACAKKYEKSEGREPKAGFDAYHDLVNRAIEQAGQDSTLSQDEFETVVTAYEKGFSAKECAKEIINGRSGKTEAKKIANYSWKGGEQLWTAVRGKVESVMVMSPTPSHQDGFMVSFEDGDSKIVYGPDLFKTQEEAEEDLKYHEQAPAKKGKLAEDYEFSVVVLRASQEDKHFKEWEKEMAAFDRQRKAGKKYVHHKASDLSDDLFYLLKQEVDNEHLGDADIIIEYKDGNDKSAIDVRMSPEQLSGLVDIRHKEENELKRRRALELSESQRRRGGKPLHESTPGEGRSLAKAGLVKIEKDGFYGLEAKSGEQVAPTIYTWIDDEVSVNGMIQVRGKDGSKGAIEAFIAEGEDGTVKMRAARALQAEYKKGGDPIRAQMRVQARYGIADDMMKKVINLAAEKNEAEEKQPKVDKLLTEKKRRQELVRRRWMEGCNEAERSDRDYAFKPGMRKPEAPAKPQGKDEQPPVDDKNKQAFLEARRGKLAEGKQKDGKFGVFVYKKGDGAAKDDEFMEGSSSYWDNKERAIQVGKQVAASLPAKTHYVEVWEKDAEGLWGNTGKPLWKSDAVAEAKGPFQGFTHSKLRGQWAVPEPKAKKEMVEANDAEHLSHKYYELEYNGGNYKYSLGNLSDAGWFWNGTKGDNMMLLFLYRLVHSKVWTPELKKQLVDFKGLADFYKKARTNNSELTELAYSVAGDNVTFGYGHGYWDMFEDEIDYDKNVPTNKIEDKVKADVKAWLKKDLPGNLAGFLDWADTKENIVDKVVEIWNDAVYSMALMKSEKRDESAKVTGFLMTEESFRNRRSKHKMKTVRMVAGAKRIGECLELGEASKKAMTIAKELLDEVYNDFDLGNASEVSDEVADKIRAQCEELKKDQALIKQVAEYIDDEHRDYPEGSEIQLIFLADKDGNVRYEYFGHPDYWGGASWEDFPHRSHVMVPSAVEESGSGIRAEIKKIGEAVSAISGANKKDKVTKSMVEDINNILVVMAKRVKALAEADEMDDEEADSDLADMETLKSQVGEISDKLGDGVDVTVQDILPVISALIGVLENYIEVAQKILDAVGGEEALNPKEEEPTEEPTEKPGENPESNTPETPSDLSQAVPPPGQESRQGRDNLQESHLMEGTNTKTITDKNGNEILVSYQTPVAAKIDGKYYRTEKNWSATTSKHIGQYLPGQGPLAKRKAEVKPQEWFDQLLKVGEMQEAKQPTNAEVLKRVEQMFKPDFEFVWKKAMKVYTPVNDKSAEALEKAGFGDSFTADQEDAVQSKISKLYPGVIISYESSKGDSEKLGEAKDDFGEVKLKDEYIWPGQGGVSLGKVFRVDHDAGGKVVRIDILFDNGEKKSFEDVAKMKKLGIVTASEWKNVDEAKETSADKLAKKIKAEDTLELVDILEDGENTDSAMSEMVADNVKYVVERELGKDVVKTVTVDIEDKNLAGDNPNISTDMYFASFAVSFKDGSVYNGRVFADGIINGDRFDLHSITVGGDELRYFGP